MGLLAEVEARQGPACWPVTTNVRLPMRPASTLLIFSPSSLRAQSNISSRYLGPLGTRGTTAGLSHPETVRLVIVLTLTGGARLMKLGRTQLPSSQTVMVLRMSLAGSLLEVPGR